MNQAGIEIGLFSRRRLRKRRIGVRSNLRRRATAWNRRANSDRIAIRWKFTGEQARKLNYL